MTETLADFYERLAASSKAAGLPIISGDWACKLLAWLYAFGGGNEAVVFNDALYRDIKFAQKRLNLEGGEIPNTELLPKLQGYLREVEPYLSAPTDAEGNSKPFVVPEWVKEICERYGLKIPK